MPRSKLIPSSARLSAREMAGIGPGRRPARRASITDVEGVLVGHSTLRERPTGCTVVTSKSPFVAGCDVRGGAPGTYDIELLKSEHLVDRVDALFLSGGSAFGLTVGAGVSKCLEEQGRGFKVGALRVPIVCGAILFDLHLGDSRFRPGIEAGYNACRCADAQPVEEGNVGAGAGATIGKFAGLDRAMKGGLGSFSLLRADGLQIGALAAVNPVGNVIDPATGEILAGARKGRGAGFLRPTGPAGLSPLVSAGGAGGTVLGVVATNAVLTKPQCNKLAQMAQDALARCVDPAHLPWDGDTTFALSTGAWRPAGAEPDLGLLGALAAEALAMAIVRGAWQAVAWGNFPSCRDVRRLPKEKG